MNNSVVFKGFDNTWWLTEFPYTKAFGPNYPKWLHTWVETGYMKRPKHGSQKIWIKDSDGSWESVHVGDRIVRNKDLYLDVIPSCAKAQTRKRRRKADS
jgi:hypothetical protein